MKTKIGLNPNFIFNSLNSLQSILLLQGEKTANEYIASFANLIRETLEINRRDFTTLKREINYLKSYVQIEAIRLKQDLKFNINLSESINPRLIKIPCMFLQPIVENSIIHGLYHKKGEKMLDLSFSLEGDFLRVEVEDNGIGREESNSLNSKSNKRHNSLATSIMKDRIRLSNLINKDRISLDIIDLKNNGVATGTSVVIKLPIKLETSDQISISEMI